MSGSNLPEVGCAADGLRLYLAFDGGATHRTSLTAERLVSRFLAGGPDRPTLILDLDGCMWVDSTFAGWMIGLRQRLSEVGGCLILSGCSGACRSSLEVMGLTSLFEFRALPRPPQMERVPCPEEGADEPTIEFMLEAHQKLAEVSPENREVFARIAEELRRELNG
jgi:anti-anti-sigma regulatory factor